MDSLYISLSYDATPFTLMAMPVSALYRLQADLTGHINAPLGEIRTRTRLLLHPT